MTDFTIGNGAAAVWKNLDENSEKLIRAYSSRISHVYDAAKLMIRELGDGGSDRLIKDLLTDESVRSRIFESELFASAARAHETSDVFPKNGNFDMMCFCRALTENEKYTPAQLSEIMLGQGAAPSPPEEKKIALLKNAQASRAFELFAANIRNAMYVYEDNFSDACEAVFEDRANFAVIPLSSSSDGRLDGLYRMMEKYSLTVNMTCGISSPDGSMTRFALAGKSFSPTFSGGRAKFEIKITLSEPSKISEILEAAEFFGATTDSLDSLPDIFGRGDAFGMIFDIENADATGLITYLSLKFSQFITIGIYPHITEE